MNRLLIATTLVAALVACSSSRPAPATRPAPGADSEPTTAPPATAAAPTAADRPASVTDHMVDVADRLVVAFEAMGRDLEAAGTDCNRGASALRTHTAAIKPIAAEAAAFEDHNDPAAEQWFEATYARRLTAAMNGLIQVASECGNDPGFQAATEEFGQAMDN